MQTQEILDFLGSSMLPDELRDFAKSITRLADAIDQNWNFDKVKSNYIMFSKAAQIEKNSLSLSFSAVKEEHRAKIREEAIGSDLVGMPAWNILLELFKQFSGGARVSTKSLQIISRCPETTALRIIDRLEERGLCSRSQCETDKRVTFVALTREGVVSVGSVLQRFSD